MMPEERAPASSGRLAERPGVPYAFLLWLLLAAVGLAYILTLRPGQPWHEDFALYVLHARNLVEGRAYGDTGYLYNPAAPLLSPAVYPPGFPLLLTPVYAVFGTDLFALRIIVVLSVVAAVAIFAALIRPALPPRLVLIAAALIGFQPFFLRFKNLLLPDFSFLAVVLLSLYLVRRLHEARSTTRGVLALALLAGVCIYFAVSLRTVGITLFGALALYHVLRLQRPSVPVLLCVAVAALLYAAQASLMPSGSGYAAQWADIVAASDGGGEAAGPPAQLVRVRNYFAATDILWSWKGELTAPPSGGIARIVVLFLMLTTSLLAVIGYVRSLRRVSVVETFVAAYLGVLVLRGTGARYLIPIIPLLFYYAILGLGYVTARGGRVVQGATLVLAGLVSVIYVGNLVTMDRSPYPSGVTGRAATEVFDYIRTCTPPDARLAAFRPRALALFTGRASMPAGARQLRDEDAFLQFVESADIRYVFSQAGGDLDYVSARLPDAFTVDFRNREFVVYRHTPATGGTGVSEPPRPACMRDSSSS